MYSRVISIGVFASLFFSLQATADPIADAVASGKTSIDLDLRHESVEQDNALRNANALTLRSRLGFTSGEVSGFSAKLELEDNRIVSGVDSYSVPPTSFNTGKYSVIADPEHTEVDQGYLQYKNDDVVVKLGRQVITYDGHRFVGHVGWRHDRQTYDGLSVKYKVSDDITANYAYLEQRNRIFAEDADIWSDDHLVNLAWKVGKGTATGYGYMLEVDNGTDNKLDTFGASYKGAADLSDLKLVYHFEYAKQDMEAPGKDFDANYRLMEAGMGKGSVMLKSGIEVLGTDGGKYGFATPLATLHKFNGWSDQFLGTPAVGLEDFYISLSGKVVGGKLVLAYHDYEAEKTSSTLEDFGDELNLLYVKTFAKHYKVGIKHSDYSAGDTASGKVDTEKTWVWLAASF